MTETSIVAAILAAGVLRSGAPTASAVDAVRMYAQVLAELTRQEDAIDRMVTKASDEATKRHVQRYADQTE